LTKKFNREYPNFDSESAAQTKQRKIWFIMPYAAKKTIFCCNFK